MPKHKIKLDPQVISPEGFIKPEDAAAILSVSTKTIYDWIQQKKMLAYKVGPKTAAKKRDTRPVRLLATEFLTWIDIYVTRA